MCGEQVGPDRLGIVATDPEQAATGRHRRRCILIAVVVTDALALAVADQIGSA